MEMNKCIDDLYTRVECVESSSFDGTITWIIKHYSKFLRMAKETSTTSILSEPFYTEKHVYKMCLQLFPYGDGCIPGSEMSLFFVIMKGDYDDSLPWPFKNRIITMSLMNREDKKHHEVKVRATGSYSHRTSYDQPTTNMNKPIGSPLFMNLSQFNRQYRKYVVDDTMYIRAVVRPC
jgi:hypothetical protein